MAYVQQLGECNRRIERATADCEALFKELEVGARTKAAAVAMMAQTPSQTQKIEEVTVNIYEDGGKAQHNANGVKIVTLADKQKVQFAATGGGYVVSGGPAKVARDENSDSVTKEGVKATVFKSKDKVVVYADHRVQFYADGNCLITFNSESKWGGNIEKLQLCINGTVISVDGDGKTEQLEQPAGFAPPPSKSKENLRAAVELDTSIAQSSVAVVSFSSLLTKLTSEQAKVEQIMGAQEANLALAEAEAAKAKELLSTEAESTTEQDGVKLCKYAGGVVTQHNPNGCVIVKLGAGKKVQINADGSSLVVDTAAQTLTVIAPGCRSIRQADGTKLCWYAGGDRSMNEAHGPGKLQMCADGVLILVEAGDSLLQMMPDKQVIIARDAAGAVKQYSADGMEGGSKATGCGGGGGEEGGAATTAAAAAAPVAVAPVAAAGAEAAGVPAGTATQAAATAVAATTVAAPAGLDKAAAPATAEATAEATAVTAALAALPVAVAVNPNAGLSHTIHYQLLERAEQHLQETHEYSYGRPP
jgi:hypothetical protein